MRIILVAILASLLLVPTALAVMTDADWADIEKDTGVGNYSGVEWNGVKEKLQADKASGKYGNTTAEVAEARVAEGKEFLKKAEGLNMESKQYEDKRMKLDKVMDFYKVLMGEDEKFLEQFKRTGNFTEYTVVEGDWLSKLAEYEEVYGPGKHMYRRWPEIYDANKDLIKDPDLIYPGWVLKIPRP